MVRGVAIGGRGGDDVRGQPVSTECGVTLAVAVNLTWSTEPQPGLEPLYTRT